MSFISRSQSSDTKREYIENELAEVRKVCEQAIEGTKLVSCVETMVRVQINVEGLRKIVICFQFPQNYPRESILFELKSASLSSSLLRKLTEIVNTETKKVFGKPQILYLIKFVKGFLIDNPLCVCFEEISRIKKCLTKFDELKLKQKNSLITLNVKDAAYFLTTKISVPINYFTVPISLSSSHTNLPRVLERFLLGQALVITKQCTEPSATRLVRFKGGKERIVAGKKIKAVTEQKHFECTPSLEKAVLFLIDNFRLFVNEICQHCRKKCLPDDPQNVQQDESADDHIERVYCGHLFHLQCLLTFMKTPPFQGGKKCPACGDVISHDKWRVSERLNEARWAHQQARDRELEEVADFFQ